METVDDLYEDLKDGWVLYALLEELSGQSLRPLGKLNRGKLRIQHVDNMNVVFKYLTNTVKIVGIGPQDIVDSTNHTLVLGLIWSIYTRATPRHAPSCPAKARDPQPGPPLT